MLLIFLKKFATRQCMALKNLPNIPKIKHFGIKFTPENFENQDQKHPHLIDNLEYRYNNAKASNPKSFSQTPEFEILASGKDPKKTTLIQVKTDSSNSTSKNLNTSKNELNLNSETPLDKQKSTVEENLASLFQPLMHLGRFLKKIFLFIISCLKFVFLILTEIVEIFVHLVKKRY